MKEELITYETAVLAKEKGFDFSTPFKWIDAHPTMPWINPKPLLKEIQASLIDPHVSYAPTQSLLQRWLREVHNILVEPTHYTASHFTYKLYKRDKVIEILFLGGVNEIFHTYEQALEKGLLEALKLIK